MRGIKADWPSPWSLQSGSLHAAPTLLLANCVTLLVLKKVFIYFWLHWVFVAVCGLSLVAVSGEYSGVAACGLLTAVGSVVAEHRL